MLCVHGVPNIAFWVTCGDVTHPLRRWSGTQWLTSRVRFSLQTFALVPPKTDHTAVKYSPNYPPISLARIKAASLGWLMINFVNQVLGEDLERVLKPDEKTHGKSISLFSALPFRTLLAKLCSALCENVLHNRHTSEQRRKATFLTDSSKRREVLIFW